MGVSMPSGGMTPELRKLGYELGERCAEISAVVELLTPAELSRIAEVAGTDFVVTLRTLRAGWRAYVAGAEHVNGPAAMSEVDAAWRDVAGTLEAGQASESPAGELMELAADHVHYMRFAVAARSWVCVDCGEVRPI